MLFNNDYYGSTELGKYACYVVADGIESGDIESPGARIAVQAAISEFQAKPSIRRGALRRYVAAAHRALRENSAHLSLKASITVVVTNYQSVRYAWAGNTRFCLYRSGRLLDYSRDHSLSEQLVRKDELQRDKIAEHEERTNLARYAGQQGVLFPKISRKINLKDGDIFSLLTRGVWEQCDVWDIKASLDSAEKSPQLALEGLERLILDAHPERVDNYTAAIIFVDKVYIDPNKGKKLKRILAIVIPILAVILIVAVVLIIRHNINEDKRRNMQTAYLSAIEYMGDENFPKAADDLKTSLDLAKQLKDKDFEGKTDQYTKLVEAILNADDLFAAGSYEDAQSAYTVAGNRSRFTDNAARKYIDRKLKTVDGYLSVFDFILLGDILLSVENYSEAESKYLTARQLASGLSYADGRKQAMEALQNLYDLMDKASASSEKAQSQAQDAQQARENALREAAEMEASGDKALTAEDLAGAKLFYTVARERFREMEDMKSVTRIDGKMTALDEKASHKEAQIQSAVLLTSNGDQLYDGGRYVDAKIMYIAARNIYSNIRNDIALSIILSKIESCDNYINKIQASPTPEEPEASSSPNNSAVESDTAAELEADAS